MNDREEIKVFLSKNFAFNSWCGWKYIWIVNSNNGIDIYASKTDVQEDKIGFTSETERMIGSIKYNGFVNEKFLFERGELYESRW